jgi:uncharacterized protein YecE (DUF72 family)
MLHAVSGKNEKGGQIRVGIGGWTYPPWRGSFYPKGLVQAKELNYAAAHLTSIEINATFYRLQTPASFRKWKQATPDGLVFSVKGPRLITHRQDLATAGDFISRFLGSGLTELGDRLGPLVWQFAPNKAFEATDFGGFLELLPRALDGLPLRHAVEVRHESFRDKAFLALLREFEVPVVFSENEPSFADLAGDFVYARLQRGKDKIETGYPIAELDAWAGRARTWAAGKEPSDLPRLDASPGEPKPRDVFLYFIHAGKLRAPHAAMALIERLA